MKSRLAVVAAVLHRRGPKGLELALFQRKAGDTGAGLWEFPGGKIEPGESPEQALIREIDEELALPIKVKARLGQSTLEVTKFILELTAYWVEVPHFNWTLNDHDGFVWVDKNSWRSVNVAPLDIPLLEVAFEPDRVPN